MSQLYKPRPTPAGTEGLISGDDNSSSVVRVCNRYGSKLENSVTARDQRLKVRLHLFISHPNRYE